METLFENAYIGRTAKTLGFIVLNIEHGAHFIAILCLETAIVKIDIADHFGIDKTKAFLLTVSYQVRTENFKIVYIDQVLIVAATANRILRGEFIVGTDKDFDQAFYTGSNGGKIDH